MAGQSQDNMQPKSSFFSLPFWLALALVLLAIVLNILAFNGKLAFIYFNSDSIPVHHLLSWTGAGFIAIYTPLFSYFKRRSPKNYTSLIQIHVFGNLLAFVMVSIHFAHHLREFKEIIPHPATGTTLFTGVALLVVTGIVMRYQLARNFFKPLRSFHTGLMVAFYLIVLFHVLIVMEVF